MEHKIFEILEKMLKYLYIPNYCSTFAEKLKK